MRNKHYKNKSIRISEEVWQKLLDERKKSGKSWNLFVVELLDKKKKCLHNK